MCVRETAMPVCGTSCLCCAAARDRQGVHTPRPGAHPNLLLMEEASEVAIKHRASVKLEGSHMRTRLVPGQGVAAW